VFGRRSSTKTDSQKKEESRGGALVIKNNYLWEGRKKFVTQKGGRESKSGRGLTRFLDIQGILRGNLGLKNSF